VSSKPEHQPKYPIYIISKGRADTRLTSKALELLKVPYYIAVEEHEYDAYCAVIDPAKVLKLPFSNHGKGSGVARNWVWEHSIANGFDRHWILDDNIKEFWRFHHNQRIRVQSGSFFRACEDFCDRYENIGLAGLQYKFFCMDNYHHPPFIQNTRLMSCILIDNKMEHRWRGKYNEDVDLSLRVLKSGLCTILFYAFLQGKMRTGTMKGGNTEELYGIGTFEKSKMLVEMHPDCVKLVRRYGRWHHDVNMKPFRNNKLIKKEGLNIKNQVNNYGLVLADNFGTPEQCIVEKPRERL
jgi:hypothetical protein